MSRRWVSKYDDIINDGIIHEPVNLAQRANVSPEWKEQFLLLR